jgi:O-antigen/teichoic acid export membrane protein
MGRIFNRRYFFDFSETKMISSLNYSILETLATRVLIIGIGLLTSVITARILGPEGRGLCAVAASIGALGVQFGNLGLHASNIYHVARDPKLLQPLVGNTLMVSFGIGGIIATATLAVFYGWPHLAPVHGILLGFSLLYIPIGLGYLLLQNLFLGLHRIRFFNSIELINRTLAVVLMAFAILLNAVYVEVVFGTTVIALVVSLAVMVWRIWNLVPSFPLPSLNIFKEHIQYGLKVYLTDFFSFLSLRLNLLILQYMLDAEKVGYYSVAVSLTDMIYMFPMVVGTILFPKLSAMPEMTEKWKLTKRMTSQIAWQMVLVCIVAALCSKPLILFLYGKPFAPSVPLFYLSLISVYFLSVQSVFVKYMASQGYPLIIMWIWLSILLISIPLTILLISAVGLLGVVYASIVTNFILLIEIFYFSIKYHRSASLDKGDRGDVKCVIDHTF